MQDNLRYAKKAKDPIALVLGLCMNVKEKKKFEKQYGSFANAAKDYSKPHGSDK